MRQNQKVNSYHSWIKDKVTKEDYSDKISETIPGQDTDLSEMLQRFTRGESMEVMKGVYALDQDSDEFDIMTVDINKMSKMDQMDLAQELQQKISEEKWKILNNREKTKERTEKKVKANKIVKLLEAATGLTFADDGPGTPPPPPVTTDPPPQPMEAPKTVSRPPKK